MRPAISSARIASPAYSITCPLPPAVPILPMIASTDVLGGRTKTERAVHSDQHVPRRLLQQRLRGQHVLDFRGADAEGERAERAVGGGVAVAADNGHARQADAQLRADDMHDALADVEDRDVGDPERGHVALQGFDLDAAVLLLDAGAAVGGGDVMVGDGNGRVRPPHLSAGHAQAIEGLRARDLVDEVAVDIEDTRAVGQPLHNVAVPDLVEQRARLGSGHAPLSFSSRLTTRPKLHPKQPRPGVPPRPRRPRCQWHAPARRCAPTYRSGRADNTAWRAARRPGAPRRSRR